ncbi:hypothetical protein DERF_011175 [Dermatophagoides farinae]|uniref:Uncharacterized protein n=1 Tax=Dermatophagoides farinae TaxID=6954 RepID=A0A922HUE9_DERFA|nr:hypothetical protein DERF_011175 [Dermatophagoides farinae]
MNIIENDSKIRLIIWFQKSSHSLYCNQYGRYITNNGILPSACITITMIDIELQMKPRMAVI